MCLNDLSLNSVGMQLVNIYAANVTHRWSWGLEENSQIVGSVTRSELSTAASFRDNLLHCSDVALAKAEALLCVQFFQLSHASLNFRSGNAIRESPCRCSRSGRKRKQMQVSERVLFDEPACVREVLARLPGETNNDVRTQSPVFSQRKRELDELAQARSGVVTIHSAQNPVIGALNRQMQMRTYSV